MLGTLLFLLAAVQPPNDTMAAVPDYAPRAQSLSPRRFSEQTLHGGVLPPDTTKRQQAVQLSDG